MLITVHELGHMLAAKSVGIGVVEFALGMGPAIFKKEIRGTVYSLRIIPIGGFCKMEGEDAESDNPSAFGNKSLFARFITLASGALMNLLLGFLIFLFLMSSADKVYLPIIGDLTSSGAASEIGLEVGDRITHIGGTRVNTQNDVQFEMARFNDESTTITINRAGKKLTFDITPKYNEQENRYLIGYTAASKDLTFIGRMEYAFYQSVFMGKLVLVSLTDLVTGKIKSNDISGPVGIVSEISSAAKRGYEDLLYLTALITINLGIFNLLPIPALDGGRIMFLLAELVTRRKPSAKVEGIVHLVGFALLILLMLFTTSNDLMKVFS